MPNTWKDLQGAVLANTVYADGELCCRNATITLPEIANTTVELKAGGTIELPITSNVDAMEATITLGAPDNGFGALAIPSAHDVEVRWVQDSMDIEGKVRQVGYKAFMRAYSKTIPGLSIEVGSASENELTLGITRYQLYADGEEVLCIDQLNSIYRVNGTDYAADINALL